MSSFGIVDSTVGLPLYDLSCVPVEAAERFPSWLRPNPESCAVPRIYQVFLAVSIGTSDVTAACDAEASASAQPETKATLSVVAVTYNTLLVGDLDSGRLTHHHRLHTGDIIGIQTAIHDPSAVAVITTGQAAGGDLLLQIPMTSDALTFRRILTVLVAHHTMKELPAEDVSTLAELRGRVYYRCPSGEERHSLQHPVHVPFLLWSTVNSWASIIRDRLDHVKETFAAVDRETKEAASTMHSDAARAENEARSVGEQTAAELESVMAQLHVENRRRDALEAKAVSIEKQRSATAAFRSNLVQLRLKLGSDQQHWAEVLHARNAVELKEKETNVAFEKKCAGQLAEARVRIEELEQEAAKYAGESALYQSLEYDALTQQRDDAVLALKEATALLEAVNAPQTARRRGQVDEAVATTLDTNNALRKLLQQTEASIEEEHAKHMDLHRDLIGFTAESNRLYDEDLLAEATLRVDRDVFARSNLQVEHNNRAIADLQLQLEEKSKGRSFFLVGKDQLNRAVVHRQAVEEAARTQSTERSTRRIQLQQRLFEEKVRLEALKAGRAVPPMRRM